MGKKLNAQLIQMRCKTDKLDSIDKINLWGNDLEDVSILRSMPNVKVVSLSLNKISTLEDFAYWRNLTELYLRKNDISDLKEIHYLAHLPNLETLWLSDNPISAHKSYRPFVIKLLPNLRKLDEVDVSPEEKAVAQSMDFDDEDLSMANAFAGAPSGHNEQYDQQDSYAQNEPYGQEESYAYESPAKQQYEAPSAVGSAPSHPTVQRTPPKSTMEEVKQPSYGGMPEQIQYPTGAGRAPESWSKGPASQHMYAGGGVPNYGMQPQEMRRPQTSGNYYGEAPPLRYGMNETGSYLPKQPKLMHANSTPSAGIHPPGGAKYKNENILWAVLVLLKDLEENELELVKRDIDKKLSLKKLM